MGNYRVEKQIGAGGMGTVYLLRHVELPETLAALKVLAEGLSNEAVERFHQEARAAAAVGSHRVARPIDKGQFDDGRQYIVMEYVDGHSLADELKRNGPMPVATALKIVLRIADTMVLAHRKGIIHRDLKPQNIMLTQEGGRSFLVKLLDFGVARTTGALRLVETNERLIVGTPGYMSPEAATGLGVDGRTDVFSLGVILFQLLTGELPFPVPPGEDGYRAAVLRLLRLPAPTVASYRPARLEPAPPAVEELVGHALAKEPSARFTMVEFHAAAARALRELDSELNAPARLSTIESAPEPPLLVPTLRTEDGRMAALLEHAGAAPAATPISAPGPALAPTPVTAIAPATTPAPATPATMPALSAPVPATMPALSAPARPARRGSRRLLMGGLVALAAGGVFGGLHFAERPQSVTPAVAPAPPKTAPAPTTSVVMPPLKSVLLPEPKPTPKWGRLVIAVRPWATVFVDGKRRDSAPCSLRLVAGRHALRLVNAPLHRHEELAITIEGDGMKRIDRDWQAPISRRR